MVFSEKPELLHKALLGAHSLVTAWTARLIGLGNAISDGCLVVDYRQIRPCFQSIRVVGIGTRLMQMLMMTMAFTSTCSLPTVEP